MLIYVQIFGALSRTLPMELRADESIGELEKRILAMQDDIVIKRCIFSGKQLDDQSKTIAQYDIHKESTIQVFCSKLAAEEPEAEELKDSDPDKAKADADAAAAAAPPKPDAPLGVDPDAPADVDALPPLSARPFIVRQPTNFEVQYGDILVVKLIGAKNLMAVDWNGTSDPYAILAVDKQSAKSSIVKRQLNPTWGETFMFWVDLEGAAQSQHAGQALEDVQAANAHGSKRGSKSGGDALAIPAAGVRSRSENSGGSPAKDQLKKKGKLPSSRHLQIMLYDHDWVRSDEPLGFCEVSLDSLPRDAYIERWITLQGAKNGEVHLSLQRCSLSSPHMQRMLKALAALGRPIKQADLQQKGVSLRQLLGQEPYISVPASSKGKVLKSKGDKSGEAPSFGGHSIEFMPALSHLAARILDTKTRFQAANARTLQKVLWILRTQQVVDLDLDLPTRYLWFSNLGTGGAGESSNSSQLSASNLFITLRKHFPSRIKRMLIPRSQRQGAVYVWFKRTEDAILCLLSVLDMRPIRVCFGQRFEPEEDHLLFGCVKAGILNIAGPFDSVAGLSAAAGGLDAASAASMSDDLPPGGPSSAGSGIGPLGGTARAVSIARQSSNCNNDAPSQKGKKELEWKSYWTFIAQPDYAHGRPAVLYGLRRTADFNATQPLASKWAFRVELSASRCEVVRSGAWSIELIDHSPAVGSSAEDPAASPSRASRGGDEKDDGAAAPVHRVDENLSRRPSRTYFIRAHSAAQVDEWHELLKACRQGETILSPRKGGVPASPYGSGFGTSPAVTPSSGGGGDGSAASPPASVPASPSASGPFAAGDEVTRVYCLSCQKHKSILDIYTLDAALDVAPTHHDTQAMAQAATATAASLARTAGKNRFAGLQDGLDVAVPVSPPSAPSSSVVPHASPITQFTITACKDCLMSNISARLAEGAFDELSAQFSVSDLQDLLPRDKFEQYLDQSTSALLDANPRRYVRCPKCACPLEVDHHTWSSKSSSSESFLQGLVGLDKQPLDDAAKNFFLANRFLCRGCRADFCRACKAYPFHPGFSCDEYKEYLSSPKCRYCDMVVTPKTRMESPPSLAFAHVCKSAECAAKVESACLVVKKCGHPCPGARDELECPPCMHAECADRDPKAETLEDSCSICYTEELGQAPILKLASCNHIFHVACLRARLQAKWASARIAFEFLRCPLCHTKMQHMLLTDLLRPFFHLESQVRVMSLQRLEFEALQDHTDIISPEGRFYNDPAGFAENHYMFYQCFDCLEPYFAGARACGVAGADEEVKREDLICGGCQKVESMDDCPTHGSSFLIFKCRFCCNFSTYFCFGKTHFCDACHSGNVWPQLVTSAGVNLKTYDQYTQCAGIKDKVLAICNNQSLSKEEQEKQLSHTWCDPKDCPLNIRHLPSGFEFGFGCGMCKPSEQKNSEAEKLRREEDLKMKHLLREGAKEVRRWKVEDEGVVIKPNSANENLNDDAGDSKKKGPRAGAEEEEKKEAPKPASLSLHAEPAAAALGQLPAPRFVRSGNAAHNLVVRHRLHADGDDLEVLAVDKEGSPLRQAVDARTGGLAGKPPREWLSFSSKRAIAYGCHFFQLKIVQAPPAIYAGKEPWDAAQMVVGIMEEEAEVPLHTELPFRAPANQPPGTCPLAHYSSKAPAFANTGGRVDVTTGHLSPASAASSFRAGDVIGVLVDLDQPGGVQMALFKNGFELPALTYTGLKLNPKHSHVKLVASFRGAGWLVSLCDLNFLDRAQYNFEVDNAVPADQRLPKGANKLPPMAQHNLPLQKVRWLPLIQHADVVEVPEELLALGVGGSLAEGDEDEDEEEHDMGEGHHDPATMFLCPQSEFTIARDLEVWYGPGGGGAVVNVQGSASLPIWGQSDKQYYEITVLDRGVGNGGYIGMGLCLADYPSNRMPGWDPDSFGYHGDDGKAFRGPSGMGQRYGPTWKVGDVIGMCIDRKAREIFYTVNGSKLQVAFRDVDIDKPWVPLIGFHSEGEKVSINFGTTPFKWDYLKAYPFKFKKGEAPPPPPPKPISSVRDRLDRFFANRDAAARGAAAAAAGLEAAGLEEPAKKDAPEGKRAGRGLFGRVLDDKEAAEYRKKKEDEEAKDDEDVPEEFKEKEHPPGDWTCEACTYHNKEGFLVCEICATARGKPAPDALARDEAKGGFDIEEKKEVGPLAPPPPPPPPEVNGPPPPPPPPVNGPLPPPPPPEHNGPPPPPPPRKQPSPVEGKAQTNPEAQEEREAPNAREPGPFVPLVPQRVPSPDYAVRPPSPPPPLIGPPPCPSMPGQAVPPPQLLPVGLPLEGGPSPPVARLSPIPAPPLSSSDDADLLGLLPTSLLRSESNPHDEADDAFQKKAEQVLAEVRAKKQREREQADREEEKQVEFDGTRHKDLLLELQGSAALGLDVPLGPAPKGNSGMERYLTQRKEPLKAYTLSLDLMLPADQLLPTPTSPNRPELRYFPLFDVQVNAGNMDPLANKSFFVHPNGVVGLLNQSGWKAPDPTLRPAQWSRIVVVIDSLRDRYELYIDGVEVKHAMVSFKANAEKCKRLEMKNVNDAAPAPMKLLRLFAGQVDVRKSDEQLLKLKRLRNVQVFNRALAVRDIWSLSGGGAPGSDLNNPLSAHLAGLSLLPLPPLVGGSVGILAAQPLAAVDKLQSKVYFVGGLGAAEKRPTGVLYELDLRVRPLALRKLEHALPAPRAHSASVYHKGSVWTFGGRLGGEAGGDGVACNTLLQYTPATGLFFEHSFPVSEVPPMAGHSALLIDDALYVVGADATTPASAGAPNLGVWQYRFAERTWRAVEIVANVKSDGTAAAEEKSAPASSSSSSSSSAAAPAAASSSSGSGSGRHSRRNSGAASTLPAAPTPKPKGPRNTSKATWHACVGSYGYTIVVFGGSNSLLGAKRKFAGKGCAGEFVLNPATLRTPNPTASWRNLLSPVSIGRERGPADATRIFAAGGMMPIGDELLWYGGISATATSSLYAYHTVTHRWRKLALNPSAVVTARAFHTSAFDPISGHIVIAGGQDSSGRPLLTADVIPVKSCGF